MRKVVKKRWLIILAGYVAICIVVDFYPTKGSPHFRYTGSDPSIAVWNVGWPLATMIYDSISGIHIGPFAYILFPMEITILTLSFAVIMLLRLMHNKPPRRSEIEAKDGAEQ